MGLDMGHLMNQFRMSSDYQLLHYQLIILDVF